MPPTSSQLILCSCHAIPSFLLLSRNVVTFISKHNPNKLRTSTCTVHFRKLHSKMHSSLFRKGNIYMYSYHENALFTMRLWICHNIRRITFRQKRIWSSRILLEIRNTSVTQKIAHFMIHRPTIRTKIFSTTLESSSPFASQL